MHKQDFLEKVNPVFNTAKFTLTMLAETGVEEASEYLRILGFSDKEERYGIPEDADEAKRINYIVLEARYKFLNRVIEEGKYTNVLDLACGFSPRGVLMEKKGIDYVGGDLPATVQLLSDAGSNVCYRTVDVTNPSTVLDAAASLEGPLAITTEGLFMYLTRNEASQFLEGIRRLLQKKGGCFYTPDFNSKEIFFTTAAQAFGRERAIDILTKYRDTLNSTSKTSISDTLVGRSVTKEEQLAFFNSRGFVVEEIPFVKESTVIHSLDYYDKDVAKRMHSGLCQTNGWRVSLDESYVNTDENETVRTDGEQGKICNCVIEGTTLKISLFGRIDTIVSPEVLNIFENISADKNITNVDIDMASLEYISSAGLRVLLHIAKKTNAMMRGFNANRAVREIFETTGFVNVISL